MIVQFDVWTDDSLTVFSSSRGLFFLCSNQDRLFTVKLSYDCSVGVGFFLNYGIPPPVQSYKSGCCRLCEYWLLIGWNYTGVTQYWEVTSLVAKQVYLVSVKRATWTDFVVISRTTLYFLQQLSATCNNLLCCKLKLVSKTFHFR